MQSAPQTNAPRRSVYGWVILAICSLMVFVALGFTSSPRGLYLAAITEDMQIPRSLYSLHDTCRYAATAIFNLFFGAMVAKHGIRKLVGLGFISLTVSMLLNAFATNVVMFYISGTLLGIGLAWTTTAIVGNLVEKWFTSNKGTIMGVILAANGLGGAFASQLVSRFIYSSTSITGWRLSYMVTAAILAVVGVATVLIIRNDPKELGVQPISFKKVKQSKVRGENWDGIPYDVVRRKAYYYVALVAIYFTGFVLQAIHGVAAAHMKDSGIDPSIVANVLSIGSFMLMISKASAGFSVDKFGLRVTLLICHICGVAGILCLAFAANSLMAYIYCIATAFALPLETIMLPLLAKNLFGSHSYSKIMGIFVAVNTLGYATGVPLMNLSYDLIGTYRPIMLLLVCVLVTVALVMQVVITIARKDRDAWTTAK